LHASAGQVLHGLLKGLVDRVDYKVLQTYLLPKHEFVIAIRLTALQARLYSRFMVKKLKLSADGKATVMTDATHLMQLLARRLRLNSLCAVACTLLPAFETPCPLQSEDGKKPGAMVFQAYHALAKVTNPCPSPYRSPCCSLCVQVSQPLAASVYLVCMSPAMSMNRKRARTRRSVSTRSISGRGTQGSA